VSCRSKDPPKPKPDTKRVKNKSKKGSKKEKKENKHRKSPTSLSLLFHLSLCAPPTPPML
jgi:hypothetical protein